MWPINNEEPDDSNYGDTDDPMDLYIFSSINQYAAVERRPSVRQLRCECTELSALASAHISSTRLMARTRLIYFDEPLEIPDPEAEQRTNDHEGDIPPRLSTIPEECKSTLQSPQPTTSQEPDTIHRVHLYDPCGHRRRHLQKMSSPSLAATQLASRLTRYARCIEHESKCPCGTDSPEALHVNIVVQNLKENNYGDVSTSRHSATPSPGDTRTPGGTHLDNIVRVVSDTSSMRTHRRRRQASSLSSSTQGFPMSPMARYNYAMELLKSGRHFEAAAHLAIAASKDEAALRTARKQLAQVITVLIKDHKIIQLSKELMGLIRNLCSNSWITPSKLECILCCDTFTRPVTTPCGHTFCRTCIERTLDYKKRCPLCLRPLHDFKVADTTDTILVQAALAAIGAIPEPPPEPDDLIPIFMCTVAYPSVPCPLFLFDPRYWMMLRRILQSGSRKFGMVAYDKHRKYTDYGTILEVRDCVLLEDGRSLLSTVGLSRFKMIERGVRDGCDVARVVPIRDNVPENVFQLKRLASVVMCNAKAWLSQLNSRAMATIEATFGKFPSVDTDEWWYSSDGPAWLWWFVAVLPLRSEIKVLMLSTNCLLKRMMAVARTLEAIEGVILTDAMA